MARHSRFFWLFVVLLSLGLALIAASPSNQAQVVRQLTDKETTTFGYYGALDDAGTAVFINSSTDQFTDNPNRAFQLFRFDAATGSGSALTDSEDGVSSVQQYAVSVSDDGQWVAVISHADLTGQNHDQSAELFVMRDDGTQLTQLTDDPSPTAGWVLKIAMAGSGNRIAFVSSYDPLSTNPDHNQQIFAINRDGTGLAQITQLTEGEIPYFTISDDGQRLAFIADGNTTGSNADDNYEVFAIDGDGSNLRQLTTTTEGNSEHVVISGNGSTIAFQSYANLFGPNPLNQYEIFAVDWNGSNLRQLTDSTDPFGGQAFSVYPSITDDGQFVFFTSNQGLFPFANPDGSYEVWKVGSDGTGLFPVSNYIGGIVYFPVVSGDGSRISFVFAGGNCDPLGPTTPEPQVCAMDGNGNNAVRLIEGLFQFSEEPNISPDGTRIVLASDVDLTGGNPDDTGEIYRIQADGSDLVQVTNVETGGSPNTPSIAGDNDTIVFSHNGNDLGTNPEVNAEIFLIHADGSGLTQLTNSTRGDDYSRDPMISSDGSVVVFYSNGDHTGGNPDNSFEIFKVNSDGGGLVQLISSSDPGTASYYPRVDQSGTWVVFTSNADLDGSNPDNSFEIFRVQTDGSGIQQISDGPSPETGFSSYPDISGSGELIVYSSTGDPLGTNPESNLEIFLYDTTTQTTQQLTVTEDGDSYWPRISQDGAYLYFSSDSPFTEENLNEIYHAFRLTVGTGDVERIGGLGFGDLGFAYSLTFPGIVTDADGDRAVYSALGNFVEENPDNGLEVYVIDLATPAGIEISSGPAPTVVSWDVEAGPIRYDVIRGDVANLQFAGGTVDLGPVVCLEDDSPDANTVGFEDPDTPAPGQVFTYLYRGSQGVDAGPGSFGRATNDFERLAGAGDCAS